MIYAKMDKCKDTHVYDFVEKLEDVAAEYEAIYLFISKIKNYKSKIRHINSIVGLFDDVVRKNGGATFTLYNDDLIVIFNKKNIDEIRAALIKVKYMFNDDPLVRGVSDVSDSKFLMVFDLKSSIREFKHFIKVNMEKFFIKDEDNKSKIVNTVGVEKNPVLSKNRVKDITPKLLANMQKVLALTDLSNLIRRQPVCVIIGDSVPSILFDEVYVSINDLRDMLFPDVNLFSNTWLFQSLTETLDKRVLSTIRLHDDGFLSSNFSININVSTVLSNDFLMFDEHFNSSSRSTITLEFNVVDVISDVKAFILAKTFAQYRGYKICVDGITIDMLKYIKSNSIDCDLVKLIWHPAIMDVIKDEDIFGDDMRDLNPSKVILSRVDESQAVEFGKSIGINLYQGRYIRQLLRSKG